MRFLRTPVARVGVVLYMCLTAVKSKTVAVSQTPAEMEVLVGDVARINCSYSSGDGDQMRIEWTRNSSARPLCYRMENKHSSGSRQFCTSGFNVTLDLSANSSSLIIYNVRLNDSGVYFCQLSVEIPPPTLTAKGEGTRLTVNARPRVWVRAEPVSTPTRGVRLTCTSLDFYPGPIQVSWFADGHQLTNGTETGPLSPNPDGSFSISSYLNLTLTAWDQGGDYTCQVNHSTLHKPITERAHASSAEKGPKPKVGSTCWMYWSTPDPSEHQAAAEPLSPSISLALVPTSLSSPDHLCVPWTPLAADLAGAGSNTTAHSLHPSLPAAPSSSALRSSGTSSVASTLPLQAAALQVLLRSGELGLPPPMAVCNSLVKKVVRSVKSRAESVENVEPVRTEHCANDHTIYLLLGQGCARES
ncbi:uncharacterized protein LOC116980246 [Amblyraja radiata]|uniref:uncharacterized protein LOC116980246 n=1 Tax=Amblyraja radiata TaxID=386614 RepID=UPI0014020C44|nr:uncharacterized protein LOC116980246 [Amblyraja radiata]